MRDKPDLARDLFAGLVEFVEPPKLAIHVGRNDDFAKVPMVEVKEVPFHVCDIPVLVNPYLDRGAYLVSEPIRHRPPVLMLEPTPLENDRLLSFRYSMEFLAPKPRTFIGIDLCAEERPKVRRRYRVRRCPARKRRMVQAKLDRRSNVRRSKRTRELCRRITKAINERKQS